LLFGAENYWGLSLKKVKEKPLNGEGIGRSTMEQVEISAALLEKCKKPSNEFSSSAGELMQRRNQ
jgi:hypothetical protein